jgi:hypothetical protein
LNNQNGTLKLEEIVTGSSSGSSANFQEYITALTSALAGTFV